MYASRLYQASSVVVATQLGHGPRPDPEVSAALNPQRVPYMRLPKT